MFQGVTLASEVKIRGIDKHSAWSAEPGGAGQRDVGRAEPRLLELPGEAAAGVHYAARLSRGAAPRKQKRHAGRGFGSTTMAACLVFRNF